MKTLNGLQVQNSFLVEVAEEKGAVEVHTVCGKVYRSFETYDVVTEADLFGLDASATFFSHGEGEIESEDFYFHRNIYGGASWSQADENSLMQYN